MNTKSSLSAQKSGPLTGAAVIPGDKSISHRALILGALAIGETTVTGLLEAEDVLNTAAAMRALGARLERDEGGTWHIHGIGIGGLGEPEEPLDMGNSGTAARLLIGLVSGHDISVRFTGDASLSKRPMQRIMTPLSQMGARFEARNGDKFPLTVYGARDTLGIEYRLPVASAQVKSAILLAGLNAAGNTSVIEETPTRDYTENMLRGFGVNVSRETLDDGAAKITVTGQQELTPCHIDVPADPSSAAFAVVAALITPGSDITLSNIGMNATRTGLYTTLIEMGGDITFENERLQGGEKVADLRVRYSPLKGITVPAARVPSMIDEFPILAVAASCASGTTKMSGLKELRVKESDRLAMMAKGLASCGVTLEEGHDTLVIHGTGKPPKGGAEIETALDHRIAMSFLVLGGVTENPVTIDDDSAIATSFPAFVELMNGLGTQIS